MDQFMARAVELAVENIRDGGEPFGAVLVKNNEHVAEGVNELHKCFDVTAHAEIKAMQRAQKLMHTHDLQGCTMYASGEPCPMCMTAMYFAGIDRVVYCATVDDAAEAGLSKSKLVYNELQKPNDQRQVEMIHMPLEKGMENPMVLWKERGDS